MIEIKQLYITSHVTIKEALLIIEMGMIKIALVVNDKEELKGILSDGDIRRALLDGYKLSDTIEYIYNEEPLVGSISDTNDQIIRKSIANDIYQIPLLNSSGKVVEIKALNTLIQNQNYVVIMAGGLGSRLRPLTDKTPKPLLSVGGKPILETIIKTFSKNTFKNFIISVNYKADMIKSYFGNGEKFGVNIQYIDETKRLGTAGSLSLMKSYLTENFFVVNADLLTDLNYNYLLQYHLAHEADATMCVRKYSMQIPYGVVNTINQDVIKIEEKPKHDFLVSGGIYVLNPSILDLIPEDEFYDMPTLFDELIYKHKKVISFSIRDRDYWRDIGDYVDYELANKEYESKFS